MSTTLTDARFTRYTVEARDGFVYLSKGGETVLAFSPKQVYRLSDVLIEALEQAEDQREQDL